MSPSLLVSFGQQKFPKLVFYIDGDGSACFVKIIEWQKFVDTYRGLIDKRNIQTVSPPLLGEGDINIAVMKMKGRCAILMLNTGLRNCRRRIRLMCIG